MIFVVIGKSGVGKDTIINNYLKEHDIKKVIQYTTRPMRKNEINGREYNFISDEEFNKLLSERKLCCVEEYKVANGDIWKYASKIEDLKKHNNCIVTCSPKSATKLNVEFKWNELTVIEIRANLNKRIERYLNRDEYTIDVVNELVRRFINDESDFLNIIPKVTMENNSDLESALNQFDTIIRRYSDGKTESR